MLTPEPTTLLAAAAATTMTVETAERLIITPEAEKPGKFRAWLESTCELIVVSDQPLADSARELLQRGHDPGAPLTFRHQNSPFDSFRAASLRRWASITYKEGERTPLRMTSYEERPFAAAGEGQKSGSAGGVAVRGRAEAEIAVRRHLP